MARISVIIPVYKVEAYLRRCVDSILDQTFKDFELILVDDGSPDGSGQICDDYAGCDNRIHVIHRENGGLSAARNTGIDYMIANSDAQWLTFVDSDDWLHQSFLERLYTAAEQTQCRISVCGFFLTSGAPIPEQRQTEAVCMEADEYYCSDKFGNATVTACAKLYHRSLFSHLRYPVGKLHEDEFTTYRALYQAGTIAVCDQQLYAYFQNPESITRSCWKPARMDVLEAFEQQMDFARESRNDRLLNKISEGYLYAAYEQLHQAEAAYRPALRKKLRRAIRLRRECESSAGFGQLHWAYEAAYPCKLLWWLVSKVRKS